MIAAVVASVALPAGALWTQVQPAAAKLSVSGFANPGAGCVVVTVDPRSLHMTQRHGRCATGDGPEVGESVVRVASRIVFRYRNSSDTKVAWARHGQSLWIYDVATKEGPLLVRLAVPSGRVLQRIPFPRLFEPVLAANADGAWLMASPSGGLPGARAAPLYHVTPAATRAVVVRRGARAALWMTGHERTLWLETVTGTSTFSLWRYDGTHGRLLWRGRTGAFGSAAYGGGSLWALTPTCGIRISLVRIDPATGGRTTVARVPLDNCAAVTPPVYIHGAVWFVDGDTLFGIR